MTILELKQAITNLPDDGEVFDGTDQYLVFGKEQYYRQTVEEIVREILGDSQDSYQ